MLTRSIPYDDIREAVYQLCVDTLFHLREDIYAALERAIASEAEPALRYLEILLENADLASEGQTPLTQDAGLPQFYIEMGQDIEIEGGTLTEALREGLKQFIQTHPFRLPTLEDPLNPERIQVEQLPLRVHINYEEGDALTIRCIRVPSESEYISRTETFPLNDLAQQVEDFVVQTVLQTKIRTTPPYLVGVGLGGTQAEASVLATKALLRPIGKPPSSLRAARIEQDILQQLNDLGLGPGGLGGATTALAVHIASAPTAPEAVPIAVRIIGSTPCISEALL